MSSRNPEIITDGAHRRGTRKRDRQAVASLRRATADRAARDEIAKLRRWLNNGTAPPAELVCAQAVINNALARGIRPDHHLIVRLENAVDRLALHTDAQAFGIAADTLAEIRILANDIVNRLTAA